MFDWAGTMIDFGCMAPVEALQDVFSEEGVLLSAAEARRDMGKAKLDHLRAILADAAVSARWHEAKGMRPTDADINRLYRRLEPVMKASAEKTSLLIPGAAETAASLHALGVKIGSGTGYTREMMADILPRGGRAGLCPRCGGLCWRNAQRPSRAVDDLESAYHARCMAGPAPASRWMTRRSVLKKAVSPAAGRSAFPPRATVSGSIRNSSPLSHHRKSAQLWPRLSVN